MPTPPLNTPRYLLLGQILRPHGVRGDLKMRLLTDYPERIRTLDVVYLGEGAEDSSAQAYKVNGCRLQPSSALLKLDGINSREDGDTLRNQFVMVPIEDAVPLDDDEFYLFQLIGLNVVTDDGYVLGTIKSYLETGANDVYIIDSVDYGEVLFPATPDTIIYHDIENGKVTVNIPDGLLPEK